MTQYFYDPAGNLTLVKDPMGYETNYEYNENNQVKKIIDARGNATMIEYDDNGNVECITHPTGGGFEHFVYDKNDRLTHYTDQEGNLFETKYYPNGNVWIEVDARENTKEFKYDGLNKVTEVINELGDSSYKCYDDDGNLELLINEEGAETHYEYDLKGQVEKITGALLNSTEFTYNAMGRVETMTNARGAITSYTYTPTGQIETITKEISKNPYSVQVTTYDYTDNGWLKSVTNHKNETTWYDHDELGRVIQEKDPLGYSTYFTYNDNSWITQVKDKRGNVTKYEYDKNGNLIKTIDAHNTVAEFGYDAMNRMTSVKLHRIDTLHNVNEFQITTYEYYKHGLLKKEINAVNGEKIHIYDGNGNLIQTTDEEGYVTKYEYDPRNLIEAINYDALNNGKEVTFGYNLAGQLIEMVDWNGTTSFTLDLLAQIKAVNDHGNNTTYYDYDEVGNQIEIIYPDSDPANIVKVEYTYDLLDRMTKLTDAEEQETIYTYDEVRLIAMEYPNGWDESYEYDANGQLKRQYTMDPSKQTNKAIEHLYDYDANGNITREQRLGTSTHGQETFDRGHTYDTLNRLTGTTGIQTNKKHIYMYDTLGNLIFEDLININSGNSSNECTEYWYNILNQQVAKKVANKDNYSYEFDDRGNLVKGTFHGNGSNANRKEEEYTYDATNRMVKGERYKNTSVQYEESYYVYNGFGDLVCNEWVIAKNAYGYTGIDSSPSERIGCTLVNGKLEGGVVVCDRHQHTTGQGHINPTGNGHTTGGTTGGQIPNKANNAAVVHKDFVLDFTDPLRRVMIEAEHGDDPGGEYLTYRYTYGLRKVSTVVYGINTGISAFGLQSLNYDAGVVEYFVNADGELEFVSEDSFFMSDIMQEYNYGGAGGSGGMMMMSSSPNTPILKLFHHQNRLGTTDYITSNNTGNNNNNSRVVSYITYDDWGALTSKAVLRMSARQLDLVQDFTGYPFDQVLGIYYAKARMYDADDRRFMALDPIKDGLNWYAYCGNNPIRYTDPLGLWKSEVHSGKTRLWAIDVGFTEREAGIIAKANNSVDMGFKALFETEPVSSLFVPDDNKLSWHYDIKAYQKDGEKDSRLWRFKDQTKKAVNLLQFSFDRDGALKEFGRGLHALQDYYAHLNWDPYTHWNPLFAGYHIVFVCKGAGQTYSKKDARDWFDKMDYDLTEWYVTVEKEKYVDKGLRDKWTEQERIFIATNKGTEGSDRIAKTERATKDALKAFKRVYDNPSRTQYIMPIFESNGAGTILYYT